jgi:flagellar P-ring protein precursor FlgI
MEQDVYTPFYKDGYITLVLDKNHASFHTAHDIAGKLRDYWGGYYATRAAVGGAAATDNPQSTEDASFQAISAIDATNIRVRIPEGYRNDPVGFTSEVLEFTITEEDPEARVVINPRTGNIVISGDVRIGDVVVVHRNTIIEAGLSAEFTPLYDEQTISPSLSSLVNQLKQLKVPPEDVMHIIRAIDRDGKLHGKLIIE